MTLGSIEEFFIWIDREAPSSAVVDIVRSFLAEVASAPWRAPSTPVPELSAQPEFEVRTAELPVTEERVVHLWYRHAYSTGVVDVIAVNGPLGQ